MATQKMNQPVTPNRVAQLDGLRGLFSIMVLLFHSEYRKSFFENVYLIQNADLFVDFFFVLSGFVIGLNYLHKINSWSSMLTF